MLGQVQIEYLNEPTRDTYDVRNLEQVEKDLKNQLALLELREEGLSGSTFINLQQAKLVVLIPAFDDDDEFDDGSNQWNKNDVEYGEDDDEDEDY